MKEKQHDDYLKRLPPEYYRGQAYVHWSMTMDDRKTGWRVPIFYYKFREVLTHAMFRYGLCCPIYCLMPDHLHLLWIGIFDGSDQRIAMKFFRGQLNPVLSKLGAQLQQQPYDHVLKEEERERTAFEDVAEYIARNPERKDLVKPDCFAEYPFTGCLVPGYPDLKPFQTGYWDLFWRLYWQLRTSGLTRSSRATDDET
ncbi:MAG: transposase [Pirellulales bacterium]